MSIQTLGNAEKQIYYPLKGKTEEQPIKGKTEEQPIRPLEIEGSSRRIVRLHSPEAPFSDRQERGSSCCSSDTCKKVASYGCLSLVVIGFLAWVGLMIANAVVCGGNNDKSTWLCDDGNSTMIDFGDTVFQAP